MDNALYIMGARQISLLKKQNRIADQVANANTTAFKVEKDVFEQQQINTGRNEKLSFSRIATTYRDFSQGDMITTARNLDIAIQGPGFFRIETEHGDKFTRAGSFAINSEGVLVTQDGHPLISRGGGQIIFNEEDTDIQFKEDGSVFAGIELRGQIGLVDFENPELLKREGSRIYSTTETPQDAQKAVIYQGMLETSNVENMSEMTNLMELSHNLSKIKQLSEQNHQLAIDAYKRIAGQR